MCFPWAGSPRCVGSGTGCLLCLIPAVISLAPDAAYQCLLLLLSNAGGRAQPGEEEEKDDGGYEVRYLPRTRGCLSQLRCEEVLG